MIIIRHNPSRSHRSRGVYVKRWRFGCWGKKKHVSKLKNLKSLNSPDFWVFRTDKSRRILWKWLVFFSPLDSMGFYSGELCCCRRRGVNCTDSPGRHVMSVSFLENKKKKVAQLHNFNQGASHVAYPPATGKCLLTIPADLRPNRPLWPWQKLSKDYPQLAGRERKTDKD